MVDGAMEKNPDVLGQLKTKSQSFGFLSDAYQAA